MPTDILFRNENGKICYYYDSVFVAGIAVDNTSYNTGTFADRNYDVRSFDGFSIVLENTGANSVDYTILSTTKEIANLTNGMADLVLADFGITEVATTTIPAGTKSTPFVHLNLDSSITAFKIRAKTTGAPTSTLKGYVRGK